MTTSWRTRGCGQAVCGACTVLVGNEAVRSCATPVGDVEGKQVLTIEGLARDGRLHPIQHAFVKHAAFQCGLLHARHDPRRLRGPAEEPEGYTRRDLQG